MPDDVIDYGVEFVWTVHEPAQVIPDAAGTDPTRCDAVVVGAGPVGLMIAAGLASAGHRVIVLEAEQTVCQSSRANGVASRTFETIDRLAPGVGTALAERSAPTVGSSLFLGQRVILQQRSHTAAQVNGKFAPSSYLSQWWLEDELATWVASQDNAELRWGSQVTEVTEGDDDVTLTVTDGNGTYTLRTGWVVAADGGRSTIRRALGQKMSGVTYGPAFIVVDAKVGGSLPPCERTVWFDPPYLPGGLLLRHIPPDGFWRLDFQFPLGTDLSVYDSHEAVAELIVAHLHDIGHDSTDVEVYWSSLYEPRSLTLDDYRHGRVLFAGDAAHLLPFFGGFGMNAGIDDAGNLAWKLARVIDGTADAALLDTYSAERIAAVRQSADIVGLSAEFMTPTSVASEELRRAALTLAAEGNVLAAGLGRHRLSRPMPLPASAVVHPDDDAFTAGPCPGILIPSLWLNQGDDRVFLPDALGPGFSWLVFAPANAALTEAAAAYGARIVEISDPEVRDVFGASTQSAYIVRPDRIVAARWRDADAAALAAAMTRMTMIAERV